MEVNPSKVSVAPNGILRARKVDVAYIDDISPYSKNLYSHMFVDKTLGLRYYAPKNIVGRLRVKYSPPNMDRVWSSYFYPLQIGSKIAKDKPKVVHIQFELNTFGPYYASLLILPLLVLSKIMNRKILVTVHSVIPRVSFAHLMDLAIPPMFRILRAPAFLYEAILGAIYSTVGWLSDALIVHTATQRRYLVEDYHVNAKKISVIPQGVDYTVPIVNHKQILFWRKKLGHCKVILYFGTITPVKGLEWLINSFARLLRFDKNCTLIIVGGVSPYYYSYFNNLKQLVNRLGLTAKVFFTGWMGSENDGLNALFKLAAVTVFPYVAPLASSGTLGMAKKHRKRIIASDIEVLKEQLSNYDNVVLVPLWDEESLAKAMLYATSESCPETGSKDNREKEDSWDLVALKTVLLYRKLIKR